jgi:hypothetical protein
MDIATYLDTLLLYFEEEVEGEAYFAELARRFDDPGHRAKLGLLAEVERHAAAAVAPLIDRYGLRPRPVSELVDSGRRDARQTPADWAALLDEMARTYPGYLAAFEALEAMAPPADLPRLAFLTEHEVAAMRFLACEARDPATSAVPLQAYLGSDPDTWARAAE